MPKDSTSDSENVAKVQRNINETEDINTHDSTDPHKQLMGTKRACSENSWMNFISRINDVMVKCNVKMTDATKENQPNGNNLNNTLNYYCVPEDGNLSQHEQLLDTLTMIDLGSESMCLFDIYKEDMIYRDVKNDKKSAIVKNCNTTDE